MTEPEAPNLKGDGPSTDNQSFGRKADSVLAAQHRMQRIRLLIAAGLVLVLILAIVLVIQLTQPEKKSKDDLQANIMLLPVPPGMTKAGPDTVVHAPKSLTKQWRQATSVDSACTAWRDVLRGWSSDSPAALGTISGEVIPGRSCRYDLTKSGYNYRVLVNAAEGENKVRSTATISRS